MYRDMYVTLSSSQHVLKLVFGHVLKHVISQVVG